MEEVSHKTLVLLRPRVSSRVSGFPLASPCLWGKLQNRVSSRSSAFPVSMWEAAKPRLFCWAHVALSMGEAAKLQSLLFLWRRSVFGGSCKTSLVLLHSRRRVYVGSCKTSVFACPLVSPCLWGKLQNIARFAVATAPCLQGSCRASVSAFCLAWLCLWGKLQNIARFALPVAVSLGKLQNLSLCLSSGVAVSMREAAKHRSFCCAHVAVSLGEAARPQSLLFLWRRRVYGGSCRTSLVCSTK